MRRPKFKKKYSISLGCIVVFILLYGILFPFPLQHIHQNRSIVWINCRYCFALTATNCDTVYFNGLQGNYTLKGLSSKCSTAELINQGAGFWYSPYVLFHICQGRIITTAKLALPDSVLPLIRQNLPSILKHESKRFNQRMEDMNTGEKNLSYYMATHNVTDEGYNQVGLYKDKFKELYTDVSQTAKSLRKMAEHGNVNVLFLPHFYCRVNTGGDTINEKRHACHRYQVKAKQGLVILQTDSKFMPLHCVSIAYSPLNFLYFNTAERPKKVLLLAYNYTFTKGSDTKNFHFSKTQGRAWKEKGKKQYVTSLPILDAAQGSPVVDKFGVLIGIADKNSIIPIN